MNTSGKYKLLLLTIYFLISSLHVHSNHDIYDNVNTLLTEVLSGEDQIDVILIDPGHGGKDVGCQGNHLDEKHLALNIALEVGALLKEKRPDLEVRFTRTDDSFVPLHKRVAMANQADVDLFISLHLNALKDPSANGIETYVMGLHTADENMEIAKRENNVIHLEDLSGFKNGYDPYSAEGHIMLAMKQQNMLEKSIQLADFTQDAIAKNTYFRNRGVKQAGFVVLRKVVVPSILIEAGFVSNPNDAEMLKSAKNQRKIALSIVEGVENYIKFYQEQ